MREYHRVSNTFPLMEGEEYEQLKADIKENGLVESIWLHPNGTIIDGRNRYRACTEMGIEPRFRTWDGAGSLVSFVVSMNLRRRHLNSSQRAVCSLDALEMLEAEAKERKLATLKQGDIVPDTQLFAERGEAREQTAQLFNTNRQYVSDAKKLQQEAPDLLERVKTGEITIPQAKKELQKHKQANEREERINNVITSPPTGKHRCIVIDPPWPVQKILRDKRPNQDVMDYPTMTLDQIVDLPIKDLVLEDGCHVYLWTTHRFLPDALEMFKKWGVKYQCLMTWVKPTGMTPFTWMYNTEHVLFGRVGSLKVERMGLKLSFEAPVQKHSRKPDAFYNLVREASPGPRLELFARQTRDGFTVWGNEVDLQTG